jgi:hypothetical protein
MFLMYPKLAFDQSATRSSQQPKLCQQDVDAKRKTDQALKALLDDGTVKVWVANLKQAIKRLERLVDNAGAESRPPDIIAIQDPPSMISFKGCRNYVQWCLAADGTEFTSEDNPRSGKHVPQYSGKLRNLARNPPTTAPRSPIKVAFLMHKSVTNFKVVEAKGKNKDLLATLFLQTSTGTIAIHNFYNHRLSLDIEDLVEQCQDLRITHVLVGDSNLHHKLWAGPTLRKGDAKAKMLVHLTRSVDLVCLNKPGDFTYSRGNGAGGKYTSVVDLTFVSRAIADRATHRILKHAKGFKCDHRISETILDINSSVRSAVAIFGVRPLDQSSTIWLRQDCRRWMFTSRRRARCHANDH